MCLSRSLIPKWAYRSLPHLIQIPLVNYRETRKFRNVLGYRIVQCTLPSSMSRRTAKKETIGLLIDMMAYNTSPLGGSPSSLELSPSTPQQARCSRRTRQGNSLATSAHSTNGSSIDLISEINELRDHQNRPHALENATRANTNNRLRLNFTEYHLMRA